MITVADLEGREPSEKEIVLYKIYLQEISFNDLNRAPMRALRNDPQGTLNRIAAKDAVRFTTPRFLTITQAERDDHELFCVGQRIKRSKCRICLTLILQEMLDRAIAFAHEVRESAEVLPGNKVTRDYYRKPRPQATGGIVSCDIRFNDKRAYLGTYNDHRETEWARFIARKFLFGETEPPVQGIMTERLAEIEKLVVRQLARQGFKMLPEEIDDSAQQFL
jgi:hypothetical protein